jgi:hypothetical protein
MLILVISNFFVSVGLFGAVKTFFREKIDFQILKRSSLVGHITRLTVN